MTTKLHHPVHSTQAQRMLDLRPAISSVAVTLALGTFSSSSFALDLTDFTDPNAEQ